MNALIIVDHSGTSIGIKPSRCNESCKPFIWRLLSLYHRDRTEREKHCKCRDCQKFHLKLIGYVFRRKHLWMQWKWEIILFKSHLLYIRIFIQGRDPAVVVSAEKTRKIISHCTSYLTLLFFGMTRRKTIFRS